MELFDLSHQKYSILIYNLDVLPFPFPLEILFHNQFFYLIYNDPSWVCKAEGKKYFLDTVKDEGRATETIARLLTYGASKNATSSFKDSSEEAAATETESTEEI